MSGGATFVIVLMLAFFGLAWWNDRHGEGRRRRGSGSDGGGDSGHGADDGCDGGDGGD
ncbi:MULTISPECIES: hypothetical protein [Sphingobium]|uniref:hypothetical protein n=1 Tax=Sphingobium TaxID=165695 RepID=UPI000DBB5173|nr:MULTISPECIES: hypothetical protein [Sphingobium]MBU0932157.1 hypothetical protein [Alphaproteobacteria bacterium]BBD00343.1 hypothetical protein YGS_C1P1598 [Sphingobium sp. YG1]